MHTLESHVNSPTSQHTVFVDYQLLHDALQVHFVVEFNKLYVSNSFGMDTFKNWGLWETDVVELFISKSPQRTPYLELQLSPLSQKFALVVETPRKYFSYPEELNITVKSRVGPGRWDGELLVPYEQIPGDSRELYGNFHACLGHSANRCYYGFQINSDQHPDFHRPDLFKKLGELRC